MNSIIYKDRIRRCCRLMKSTSLDVLLLTKPSNMFYLTGDGRLCAYAMITQKGKVEDTVIVGKEGPVIQTHYPRQLAK